MYIILKYECIYTSQTLNFLGSERNERVIGFYADADVFIKKIFFCTCFTINVRNNNIYKI